MDLSEQYLLDCAYGSPNSDGPDGCNGGWVEDYLNYAEQHQKGADQLESYYPYTAELGSCNYNQTGICLDLSKT